MQQTSAPDFDSTALPWMALSRRTAARYIFDCGRP
jgi:hypothetical protein